MPEGAIRVHFHNLLNNNVQLFWVDPANGKELAITKVSPHGETEQISFPEHQFVAREVDKEHVLLGRYHINSPEHFNIPAVFVGELDAHSVCAVEPKLFGSNVVADDGYALDCPCENALILVLQCIRKQEGDRSLPAHLPGETRQGHAHARAI
jgi:hypothetical protein